MSLSVHYSGLAVAYQVIQRAAGGGWERVEVPPGESVQLPLTVGPRRRPVIAPLQLYGFLETGDGEGLERGPSRMAMNGLLPPGPVQ